MGDEAWIGELEKLHTLKQQGIVTEQEFQAQKQRLLDRRGEAFSGGSSEGVASRFPATGGAGLAVSGMVVGIVGVLGVLGSIDTGYDSDSAAGVLMFGAVGAGLSGMSLALGRRGRGMAIAGLVMGALLLVEYFSIG